MNENQSPFLYNNRDIPKSIKSFLVITILQPKPGPSNFTVKDEVSMVSFGHL